MNPNISKESEENIQTPTQSMPDRRVENDDGRWRSVSQPGPQQCCKRRGSGGNLMDRHLSVQQSLQKGDLATMGKKRTGENVSAGRRTKKPVKISDMPGRDGFDQFGERTADIPGHQLVFGKVFFGNAFGLSKIDIHL
ncbi:MAG: hypothetical protein JEZ11_03555 [Desulfobacterales bacterium]|nr:hypothetical protein [Desulfobacterales bacterium]